MFGIGLALDGLAQCVNRFDLVALWFGFQRAPAGGA
jgi:hypothetical protein